MRTNPAYAIGMTLAVLAGATYCYNDIIGGRMRGVAFGIVFVWGVIAAAIKLSELGSDVRRYEHLVRSKGIDPAERLRYPG